MTRRRERQAERPQPVDITVGDRWKAARMAGIIQCPRPDKIHHRSRGGAQDHLTKVAEANPDTHDGTAMVYNCPCGTGWVWGRPIPGKDIPA